MCKCQQLRKQKNQTIYNAIDCTLGLLSRKHSIDLVANQLPLAKIQKCWSRMPQFSNIMRNLVNCLAWSKNVCSTRLLKCLTCHFLTMEQYLSLVRFIPWKFVRQLLPCTSSTIRRNFLNATSSFCRSARDTSNTRPFSASEAISERNKFQNPGLLITKHITSKETILKKQMQKDQTKCWWNVDGRSRL